MKKYDCSKTTDFIHEVKRICESKDEGCGGCPLKDLENYGCCTDIDEITQEQIDELQKWSDSHPEKTRQDEFLEKFPNVVMVAGIVDIKPCGLDTTIIDDGSRCQKYSSCYTCVREYWSEPYDDSSN